MTRRRAEWKTAGTGDDSVPPTSLLQKTRWDRDGEYKLYLHFLCLALHICSSKSSLLWCWLRTLCRSPRCSMIVPVKAFLKPLQNICSQGVSVHSFPYGQKSPLLLVTNLSGEVAHQDSGDLITCLAVDSVS